MPISFLPDNYYKYGGDDFISGFGEPDDEDLLGLEKYKRQKEEEERKKSLWEKYWPSYRPSEDIRPGPPDEPNSIDVIGGKLKEGVDWLGSKSAGLPETHPIEELAVSALMPKGDAAPLIQNRMLRSAVSAIPGGSLLTAKDDLQEIKNSDSPLASKAVDYVESGLRGLGRTTARFGLDPLAWALPSAAGKVVAPYFGYKGAEAAGTSAGEALSSYDVSGEITPDVIEKSIESLGDVALSAGALAHPVSEVGGAFADKFTSLKKPVEMPEMFPEPSAERGAAGKIGPLNQFEDRMYQKYGPGFRNTLSPAEKLTHNALLKMAPIEPSTPETKPVDYSDPYSVERDLLESGAMTPEELSVPVGKGMEGYAKKHLELVGPSAYKPVEPTETLPVEKSIYQKSIKNPDGSLSNYKLTQEGMRIETLSPAGDLINVKEGPDIEHLSEQPVVEPAMVAEPETIQPIREEARPVERVQESMPFEEEGKPEPEDPAFIKSVRLIDKIEKAQNIEEIRKEIQRQGGMQGVASLIDKIEKAQGAEAAFNARQRISEAVRAAKGQNKAFQEQVRLTDKIEKAQAGEEAKLRLKTEKQPTEKNLLDDLTDLPKTLRASVDISFPLRQGLFLLNRPEALSGMARGLKSGLKEQYHLDVQADLAARPNADLYKKFSLNQVEYDPTSLESRSEEYPTALAQKIPGVKQSERAFIDPGNLARANMFDIFAKRWTEQGKTPETRPDLYQGLAKYLNVLTGRDPLPKRLQAAGFLLNKAFFSPMFVKSRLQILNPVFYAKLPSELRAEALRDIGGTLGTLTLAIGAVGAIAKQQGNKDIEVYGDPADTNFGYLRVGKVKYDFFAGLRPLVRTAYRLGSGRLKTGKSEYAYSGRTLPELLGAEKPDLKEYPYGGRTQLGELGLVAETKTSPIYGAVKGYVSGRGYQGEAYGVGELIRDLSEPMSISEFRQALMNWDMKTAAQTLPSFAGVSVNLELPESEKVPKKPRKGKKSTGQFIGVY